MKIVVNTRLLLKDKLEGIGWFSFEVLKRITTQNPEHEFIFLFDRPFSQEFIFSSNIQPIIIPPPTRHPFLWYIWFEKMLPHFFKKHKPDLFFSPDGFLSLSSDIKSITTIHDINFEHHPEDIPYLISKFYRKYFRKYAEKANRIITVSEFSKSDISNIYSVPDSKIDVCYNGANSVYKPLNSNDITKTKLKYSDNKDYFIFIGALHPRKNIERLLLAFDIFKQKISSEMKLLIVGEKMFKNKDILKSYDNMKFKNDVVFTGRLSAEKLHLVLGSAFALVFVPYFEGFGIPIVEAFNCGVPVITANRTSMPEVSGNAALLVDPFSLDSIYNSMIEIYENNNLRTDLIKKGNIRKQNFSWDKTAEIVWESLMKK